MNNRDYTLTYMLDCSRNAVASTDALRRMVTILKKAGYTALSLYCENTYEVEGEPYFGYMRGRYSVSELKEIDSVCAKAGLEFTLSIQTLAHMRGIYRYKEYHQNAIDCNDVLLVGSDRTYLLIDRMFASLSKALSSKKINIGMDEPFMLGRGKYLNINGYRPQKEIFTEHLIKVLEIASRYDLKLQMWGDFLIHNSDSDEVKEVLKKYNVEIIYWDYGSLKALDNEEERLSGQFQKIKSELGHFIYAGSTAQFFGMAPHNGYAMRVADAALNACLKNNIRDIMLTAWGDCGAEVSPFAALPVIVYYAFKVQNKSSEEFKEYFESEFGSLEEFLLLDLANNFDGKEDFGVNTSSKYLLYNDVFLGFMDKTVKKGLGKVYQSHSEKIKNIKTIKPQYKYLFNTQRLLIEALKIKCDLGVRTREAYKNNDKDSLVCLAKNEYVGAIRAIKKFAKAFSRQWLTDNKPFGLEIHEARFGALIYRLSKCRKRILDFASEKTDSIPELECQPLNEFENEENIIVLNWGELISAGVMIEYNSFV